MLLSIVIPVFNEEAVIAATHARVIAVMESIAEPFEIIYIDAGSLEGTAAIIAGWAAADARLKLSCRSW